MFKSLFFKLVIVALFSFSAAAGADGVSSEQVGSLRGNVEDSNNDPFLVQRNLVDHCSGWADLPSGLCPVTNRDGTVVGRLECDYNFINQPAVRSDGRCNRRVEMKCIPSTICICDTINNGDSWDCQENSNMDYCDKPPAGAFQACTP
jgi:hypothetical protein